MSKKILVVGCGQLGSRHLQAVASLQEVSDIFVLDTNPSSLELGKKRISEISDINRAVAFHWFDTIDDTIPKGDLCIVATQARDRCRLITRIADTLGYQNFFIEKIVSQSVADYEKLLTYAKNKNLTIWVNCKTRAYGIHTYIKSKLDPSEPIVFSDMGGNHGLANNGIHAADLFIFYDGSKEIKSSGSKIDSVLMPSKRGKEIYDLGGSLYGYTDKGSIFMLSFSSTNTSPDHISIISKKSRFIVDHFQKFAFESYADQQWEWKKIPIVENWTVSHMSKRFVTDMLIRGTCSLPTLEECYPAHLFILKQLLPHFNSMLNRQDTLCPVT
ncbi:MAG: hypothetical protein GF384_05310 [Elusimicrobia bacterium]|nr:hypothetical protein [Elusimicrobiota bacterium]